MTLDLVSSSISMFMATEERPDFVTTDRGIKLDANQAMFFIFGGVSALMQFILIFWGFTLMWKTFLFRYGLIKQLFCKEFPIMFFIGLHFLLFCAEKAYRIVMYMQPSENGTPVDIYSE
eukprot:CAMPEP_0170488500 /NCGR_PEP_ID=MMETSP0208-20121228/7056_1 /TAXON_ID=197538 /ORGANISM="Strombidium inclinatum, Strain S3" /LENGTH=118 /DNA_ID=CAMNT_0010763105 /DNA_START=5 /DNA_END=358 /DNA_ORIENTATION=+